MKELSIRNGHSNPVTMGVTPHNTNSQYIPRSTQATLDDLLATAQRYGRVEIGGSFHPNSAEIKLKDTTVSGDYVIVRSREHSTIKENLAECIHKAEQVITFYRSM